MLSISRGKTVESNPLNPFGRKERLLYFYPNTAFRCNAIPAFSAGQRASSNCIHRVEHQSMHMHTCMFGSEISSSVSSKQINMNARRCVATTVSRYSTLFDTRHTASDTCSLNNWLISLAQLPRFTSRAIGKTGRVVSF